MNLIRFWINIIFFYRASLGNGAVQAKNAYFNSDTYNPQTEEGMRITGNLGLRGAMKAILRQRSWGGAAQCWPGWASSWPGCPHWHGREQPSSSVIFVTLRIIWIKISRCSRFTNSLSSNKSSVAAIFYHYFCLWGHILQTILNVTFYHPCLRNIFYVSLNLTFSLCKVLTYIFTWYFFCKPEPYIFFS